MTMTINPDIKFFDTSALLALGERINDLQEEFLISSITLKELEKIKTSVHKSEEIKYAARIVLKYLNSSRLSQKIVHKLSYEQIIMDTSLDITDDTRILSDAIYANNNGNYIDRIVFVTNDLSLKTIANLFFGDRMITSIEEEKDEYKGYKEITAPENLL